MAEGRLLDVRTCPRRSVDSATETEKELREEPNWPAGHTLICPDLVYPRQGPGLLCTSIHMSMGRARNTATCVTKMVKKLVS